MQRGWIAATALGALMAIGVPSAADMPVAKTRIAQVVPDWGTACGSSAFGQPEDITSCYDVGPAPDMPPPQGGSGTVSIEGGPSINLADPDAISSQGPTEQEFFQRAPGDSIQPSFDCARAGTSTEIAICSNPDVAHLDGLMADLYYALRSRLTRPQQATLTRQQREWLRLRDACGADAGCLVSAYEFRIYQLQ